MDEPLGALDLKLRESMQIELRNIQRSLGITTIYVTHDQIEAMNMSDRIAVMNEGVLEQIGSAEELYDTPRTKFVADFIGSINLIPVSKPEQQSDHVATGFNGREIRVVMPAERTVPSGGAVLGIRPEQLTIVPKETALNGTNRLDGQIITTRFIGNVIKIEVDIGMDQTVIVDTHPSAMNGLVAGAEVGVVWQPDNGFLLED